MKRFIPLLVALAGLSLTASGESLPPEVDVITNIGGATAVSIPVERFETPTEIDYLIPEVAGRELVNTKEVCDKKAGISATYAAGGTPTRAQYWRFDGCQRWYNARQRIGSW
jgi:hypothetical protein